MNRQKTSFTQGSDHIYYNVAVQNNTDSPFELQFQDIRTDELLANPKDYYLSVIRFLIPGSGIPLFNITPITLEVTLNGTTTVRSQSLFNSLMVGFPITGKGIPASTIISSFVNDSQITISNSASISGTSTIILTNTSDNVVTLSYEGIDYQQYVPFIQSSNYDYFSVNSYQQFLDMINVAFGNAFSALLSGAGTPPTVNYAPSFYWDPQTWLISMYCENGYATNGQPKIYMNFSLFSYFQSLKNYQLGYGQSDFKDNQIIVDPDSLVIPNIGSNLTNANSFQLPYRVALNSVAGMTGVNYLKVTQEYTSFHVWPSIESIVFQSSLAPINREFIPSAGQVGQEAQASNNSSPVLTDFVIPTDISPGAAKGNLEYLPTAEYRLVDFISSVGFSEFNIKAFWQDNRSNLYAINLEPHDYASIKFLFRKKTFKSGKSYGD